jgi:hypothetical protein
MPVIIDGTNGVSTPNTFAFKNRIIDGGFTINQRGYTSGTSLSSGSYGHDRWKGGASGGTYTFTQGSTGVNTTITITAGSIIQVIEGANLPEGGTYVLSWTGTAQGKIGSGSFGASGITGTITAGTNTNIEFNTGTCGNVQLEVGSTATSFDYRPYGTEFHLCQRYYQLYSRYEECLIGSCGNATTANAPVIFNQPMRASPTVTLAPAGSSAGNISFLTGGSTPSTVGTHSAGSITSYGFRLSATGYVAGSWATGISTNLYAYSNPTTVYTASAEL